MNDQLLLERITVNPKVMVGKPVIRGTRLTVEYVLNLLAHGATIEEIVDEYQGLTVNDIRACFLFAQRVLADTSFALLIETKDTMTWAEVRNKHPDQWLVLEALEAVTTAEHRRELQKVAVVEYCADGNIALRSCQQWNRRFPEREFCPVHTSQAIPPLYVDPCPRISPRPARKYYNPMR